MADGGTIFLDEIGTVSPKMQVELLGVLETKQFTRVGGNESISSDFRVICATNRNLEAAIKDGSFREDLYYRLNVFSISIPPLRERRMDIPLMAQFFTEKYAAAMSKTVKDISADAMDLLVRYDWPGNVRELENVIERAMVLASPPSIRPNDLPFHGAEKREGAKENTLAAMEREHIEAVLGSARWNITRAAEILDIDRVTLYNKIAKYGLKKP
jgi:DNA-binding NtrC family response regulator